MNLILITFYFNIYNIIIYSIYNNKIMNINHLDIELYNNSDDEVVFVNTNNNINNDTQTIGTQTNTTNDDLINDDLTNTEKNIYNNMTEDFLLKNIHLVFQKISKKEQLIKIYRNLLNSIHNPQCNDSYKYKDDIKVLKEELIKDHCPRLSTKTIKELKKIKVALNNKYGKQEITNTTKLSYIIEKIIKELIISKHSYDIDILVQKTCFIIFDYINDKYHEIDVLMIILITEYHFLQNIIYLLLKNSNIEDIKKNRKSVFSNILHKIFKK